VLELRRRRRRSTRSICGGVDENHHAIGVGDADGLQQNCIDDGENRRVRADAEGERRDGRQRERRALREHAEGVLQVSDECFHVGG
jgi:hypothetical protein